MPSKIQFGAYGSSWEQSNQQSRQGAAFGPAWKPSTTKQSALESWLSLALRRGIFPAHVLCTALADQLTILSQQCQPRLCRSAEGSHPAGSAGDHTRRQHLSYAASARSKAATSMASWQLVVMPGWCPSGKCVPSSGSKRAPLRCDLKRHLCRSCKTKTWTCMVLWSINAGTA